MQGIFTPTTTPTTTPTPSTQTHIHPPPPAPPPPHPLRRAWSLRARLSSSCTHVCLSPRQMVCIKRQRSRPAFVTVLAEAESRTAAAVAFLDKGRACYHAYARWVTHRSERILAGEPLIHSGRAWAYYVCKISFLGFYFVVVLCCYHVT